MSDENTDVVALANKLLDDPYCDPDDDLRVLSRQLLRRNERIAALEAYVAEREWRPIESAPRVKTPMIVVIGVWDSYVTDPYCVWWEGFATWGRWPHKKGPTHWMPLPQPPKESK